MYGNVCFICHHVIIIAGAKLPLVVTYSPGKGKGIKLAITIFCTNTCKYRFFKNGARKFKGTGRSVVQVIFARFGFIKNGGRQVYFLADDPIVGSMKNENSFEFYIAIGHIGNLR